MKSPVRAAPLFQKIEVGSSEFLWHGPVSWQDNSKLLWRLMFNEFYKMDIRKKYYSKLQSISYSCFIPRSPCIDVLQYLTIIIYEDISFFIFHHPWYPLITSLRKPIYRHLQTSTVQSTCTLHFQSKVKQIWISSPHWILLVFYTKFFVSPGRSVSERLFGVLRHAERAGLVHWVAMVCWLNSTGKIWWHKYYHI